MGRKRSGFTLVEIMIVVMIIGLLLSIAVPQWQRARERSRTVSCMKNLQLIDDAKQHWAMENRMAGTDSPSEADLAPLFLKRSFPSCPSSGTYTIHTVDEQTECSVHGVAQQQ